MKKKQDLKAWLDSYLSYRVVSAALRKDITNRLRWAGYAQLGADDVGIAGKIVDRAMECVERRAQVRVAAVVTADAPCPGCGGAMTDVTLAEGSRARYCANCRVTAHLSE